jgi:hypothetical protein
MSLLRFSVLLVGLLTGLATDTHAQEKASPPRVREVYLDREGVVRWQDDRSEVTLFGANYVLPCASD